MLDINNKIYILNYFLYKTELQIKLDMQVIWNSHSDFIKSVLPIELLVHFIVLHCTKIGQIENSKLVKPFREEHKYEKSKAKHAYEVTASMSD